MDFTLHFLSQSPLHCLPNKWIHQLQWVCNVTLCCLYQYKCPRVTNQSTKSLSHSRHVLLSWELSLQLCLCRVNSPQPCYSGTAAEAVHSWVPARGGVEHCPLPAPSITIPPGLASLAAEGQRDKLRRVTDKCHIGPSGWDSAVRRLNATLQVNVNY